MRACSSRWQLAQSRKHLSNSPFPFSKVVRRAPPNEKAFWLGMTCPFYCRNVPERMIATISQRPMVAAIAKTRKLISG